MWNFPLFPAQASTIARNVDTLMFVLFTLSLVISLGIALTIVFFAIRYHHRRSPDRSHPPMYNLQLEIIWTGIPLVLVICLFLGGTHVYLQLHEPPTNALTVYVVGKQWMWKIQHPEGPREINTLHVPLNQPVKLVMISQDVIHSFFIPAFRVKQDVLPGRYTSEWFAASRPGNYHLFCAQYCGTSHSSMIGTVSVMTPVDYTRWLNSSVSDNMASQGEHLFHQYGCISCHRNDTLRRAPFLGGLYGATVRLRGGRSVTADDAYLRESILQPAAKIVEGYDNIMPTYKGQISEEEILQLIAYLQSLNGNEVEQRKAL